MNNYEKLAQRVLVATGIKHVDNDSSRKMEGMLWREQDGYHIRLPWPAKTAKRLYVLFHEVGHKQMKHLGTEGWLKKKEYLMEFESELFALRMCEELGIPVSFYTEYTARDYVGRCIRAELKLPRYHTKAALLAARKKHYVDRRIAKWALCPKRAELHKRPRHYAASVKTVEKAVKGLIKSIGMLD